MLARRQGRWLNNFFAAATVRSKKALGGQVEIATTLRTRYFMLLSRKA